MPAITIATYSLRVRHRYQPDPLELGKFDGFNSLFDFAHRFVRDLSKTRLQNDSAQHLLGSSRTLTDASDIWGTLDAGEYGFAASGIDIASGKESYKRRPSDAEMIPLYFRLHLPARQDTGVLLLQRFGAQGVYSLFTQQFRESFAKSFPDYLIELGRLVPAEVIKELSEGQLRAVELTAYQVPSDLADKYRFRGNKKEIGTLTVTVRAKRNGILPLPGWIKRSRDGTIKLVEFPEGLAADYQRIRVKVAYKGKSRTLDFSKPEAVAPYIDVSDSVTLRPDGHPTFESIDDYCIGLRDELLEKLGKA